MGSTTAEVSKRIRSCMDQIVADLRGASASVKACGLGPDELTDVLKVAFSDRNRFDGLTEVVPFARLSITL